MCKKIFILEAKIREKIVFLFRRYKVFVEKQKLGYCGKDLDLKYPIAFSSRIYLHDYVYIYEGAKFLIGPGGMFVMKSRSGASQGLTVITGKHGHKIGEWFHDTMRSREKDLETAVIVEEDARIGANVTLLPGVTIGRGAQIGACSVVSKSVPPYSVVIGNPAKVIKFIFTPKEIVEHEKKLYEEHDRLKYSYLEKIQGEYLNAE